MSPRSSRGGWSEAATLARALRRRPKRAGFSGHWQASSQRASSAERGSMGERSRPTRPARAGVRRAGRSAGSPRASHSRATAAPTGPAVSVWSPPSRAVGVAVVVEEQVEPGRGAEVEQRERGGGRIGGRDVAEGRQQRGAPSDLVGLGGPGGDEPFEFLPLAAGRSRRSRWPRPSAAGGTGCRARWPPCRSGRPAGARPRPAGDRAPRPAG